MFFNYFFNYNKDKIYNFIFNYMIRIKNGTEQKCVFTLKENVTISNPYFIFSFEDNNGDIYNFTNTDNSVYKYRYNSFTFSSNMNKNNDNGGITASNGEYLLKIYETEYNDLIIASASSLVEQDILQIYDETSSFTFSNTQVNDDDFIYR